MPKKKAKTQKVRCSGKTATGKQCKRFAYGGAKRAAQPIVERAPGRICEALRRGVATTAAPLDC